MDKVVRALVRVRLGPGDIVSYVPGWADKRLNQFATVLKVLDHSDDPLEIGPSGTQHWVRVSFLKDGFEMTQPSTRFMLEQRRFNIVRADIH